MLLRLTTPEAFDRLIRYLEKERNLKDCHDYFIPYIKEKMLSGTVYLDIDWDYDLQKGLTAHASYIAANEITTDEDYLKEKNEPYGLNHENCDRKYYRLRQKGVAQLYPSVGLPRQQG